MTAIRGMELCDSMSNGSHCTRPEGAQRGRVALAPLLSLSCTATYQHIEHASVFLDLLRGWLTTSGVMTSPPTKRIKLEPELLLSPTLGPEHLRTDDEQNGVEIEDNVEQCSICLQPYADRTMIPTCSHEFCFECLLIWTGESPLRERQQALHG